MSPKHLKGLVKTVITKLEHKINERRSAGLLRTLKQTDDLTDFCSNDYLGFARSAELKQLIREAEGNCPIGYTGATGSRLLAGNTRLAEEVESQIAAFHRAESALLFNSGYDANLGLMACIAGREDTLITDELIHASMIDGARLSYATRYRFRHNDLADLESILTKVQGQTYVAVESVYSMDGDLAPLIELADLCDRYGAALLVDDAHATGIYGPNGEGQVVALGLEDRILARIHTYGKALGVHGAAIVGPAVLSDYLTNFARSFIYTTALPPHSYLAIRAAYAHLQCCPETRTQLHNRVACFRQKAAEYLPEASWTDSRSPIQCLIVPGNEAARQVADAAQQAGFDVRAILSPTVPAGQERLRLCIHSFNTADEIDRLLAVLQKSLAGVPTL
ncbi:pyridoxal phosphate-dependent aminotransferase family protein [Nibrella saemangeumensis]|uniref:Pyridoxal phosphate-dependent aminotransferase family protein n=1 Tax=Nibrella saemangeumensis TaxID=1084526 RepID=A0ABP8MDV1_9BACT